MNIEDLQKIVEQQGMPTRAELRAYIGETRPISEHELDLLMFGLGNIKRLRLDPNSFRVIAGSGDSPKFDISACSGTYLSSPCSG